MKDAKRKMKICFIAGARPNFMKVAALIHACQSYHKDEIEYILVHTGQHYDPEMSKVFFDELGLPRPDYNLGVGGKAAEEQKKEIKEKLSEIFDEQKFDLVVVVGDVTSTLAGAEAAKKAGIPLAHVEAGLRSRNMEMPEEGNRIGTDGISDYLFASEPDGLKNLEEEKIKGKKYLVGNVMIDTLLRFLPKVKVSKPKLVLSDGNIQTYEYAVLTLHRAENVDSYLESKLQILESVAIQVPIIFPVHPRTLERISNRRLKDMDKKGINFTHPFGYIEFLALMKNAKLVLTDSGGIQEETTILNVPCLTLRNETERPITVSMGTNEIVGLDEKKIKEAIEKIMEGRWKQAKKIAIWDGRAAERIIAHLYNDFVAQKPTLILHEISFHHSENPRA